mgnify:CR=1 FL=1
MYSNVVNDLATQDLNKLSKTEKELGGIPNSSEDIKQAHAAAIESYIEKYVGLDLLSTFRESDSMGSMYFTRTLEDWARFNINNRTKFDDNPSRNDLRNGTTNYNSAMVNRISIGSLFAVAVAVAYQYI